MILPLVNLRQGETRPHAAHRLLSALENAAPGPVLRLGGAARGRRLPCLAQLDDVPTMEAIRRARARGGACPIAPVKRTRGSGERACGRRPWRRCGGRSVSAKSHAFTTDVVKISSQVLELLDFSPRGGGFVKEL
jgi:hypothetical protein